MEENDERKVKETHETLGESPSKDVFSDSEGSDDFSLEASWEQETLRKRIKNLQAMLILACGLFVGSLYVDGAQFFSKAGFSSRALSTADVVSAAGKTWVAYDQPIVRVTVLSDESCSACQSDEVLVWLRRVMPTISVEELDVRKDERAKEIVGANQIASVPAFLFSKDVERLPAFGEASQLFKKLENGSYLLDSAQAGIPAGKYLTLPSVDERDIKFGSDEAPVRIVEFTDFQCPFCKSFHETLRNTVKQYGDKVQYVFKNYPLPIHANAESAALAGECAHEQGKFSDYADILFGKQGEWEKLKDPLQKFREYAKTLKLDAKLFGNCLDDKKYADRVKTNMDEGKSFNIGGTPGTFVNGTFLNGAVPASDVRSAIDAALEEGEGSDAKEKE